MGTRTVKLTISFKGIVARILRAKGVFKTDKILLEEILRLFNETKKEYLKGNKELADQFFNLLVGE
jgi:hypothetical protein